MSGSLDSSLRIWDLNSKEWIRTMNHPNSVFSCVPINENMVLTGCADSKIYLWDHVIFHSSSISNFF